MIHPPRLIILFSLLLTLSPSYLRGQGQVLSADSVEQYFKYADILCKQKKTDAAIDLLTRLLPVLQKHDSLVRWFEVQRTIGQLITDKKPVEGLHYLQAATTAFRQPKHTEEFRQLCFSYFRIARIADKRFGDYTLVKNTLEQAYDVFSTKLNHDGNDIADFLLLQLGNAHVRLGDYASAQRYFEEGIEYANTHDAYKVAKYNDYGSMYMGQHEDKKYLEAIKIFDRGLIKNTLLPINEVILLYLNKAEVYANLNDWEKAKQNNFIADTMLQGSGKSIKRAVRAKRICGLLENKAIILTQEKKYDAAIALYKTAIDSSKANLEFRSATGYELSIGNIYLLNNNAHTALDWFHKALSALLPGWNNGGNTTQNPFLAVQFPPDKLLIAALEGKARAFTALHQPDKALECYDLIPLVEAQLRATHAYESSSLFALKESRQRFDQAVQIAWQCYSQQHDERYLRMAFRFTEQARGLLLLRSLALAQLEYQLPPEFAGREQNYAAPIALKERLIADLSEALDSSNAQEINQLRRQQDELIRQRERFRRDTLAKLYPQYTSFQDSLQLVDAGAVRQLLRPGQVLLDYYLCDSAAFVFRFDAQGGMAWRRAIRSDSFGVEIAECSRFLSQFDEAPAAATRFKTLTAALYQHLVAPELAQTAANTSLLIVPDGALNSMPFELLLTHDVAPTDAWADLPYLIRDHSIGYAYSATLLRKQQELTRQHAQLQRSLIGGFAPKYNHTPPGDLPSAREEVKQTATILNGWRGRCLDTWLDDDACEANFRKCATNRRILLLSMHGFSDAASPERSHLLFGDTLTAADGNDNVLYANELSLLRLQADLVVLSACHTGDGKMQKGEGVYSLARAFTIAQVPATVMSLWQLSASSSTSLVSGFFEQLKAHPDCTKDEALRQAKLAFLRTAGASGTDHPYFWASLVANGDMSALDLSGDGWPVWCWVLVGLVVVLGVVGFKRSKFKSSRGTIAG